MADAKPFVGISPPAAFARRTRLFFALGQALNVEFGPWPSAREGQPAALIAWGREAPAQRDYPELRVEDAQSSTAERWSVTLRAVKPLDVRLHGLRLSAPAGRALIPAPGEQVLGLAAAGPMWVLDPSRPARHRIGFAPAELKPNELLRNRLIDAHSAEMLPIFEFVRRELAGVQRWRGPAPRACFLIDDPNLHWTSYGHVHFAELARAGAEHGFHVSIATVPLDGWFIHPRARSIFASQSEILSLIVHGSEHVRGELGRPRRLAEAMPIARSALVRVARIEARSGLSVGRVMAPPHGVCSEPMATALRLAGFEALTANSPCPWRDRPRGDDPLSGMVPAAFVAGGLPVLERQPLWTDTTELALRAYVGQPLILYGHHRDLSRGSDVLASIAGELRRLGIRRWLSPERIARSNLSTYQRNGTLHVRLHSRYVELQVPAGVTELVVELPDHPWLQQERLSCEGRELAPGEPIPVVSSATYRLRLTPAAEAEYDNALALRVWPLARRVLTEGRDRGVAIADRALAAARRL